MSGHATRQDEWGVALPEDQASGDPRARTMPENRYEAMFNEAAVGIGVLALDRKILYANPAACRMFGMSLEELQGTRFAAVVSAEDAQRDREHFQELMAGTRSAYRAERRYLRKDESSFWGRATISLVRDADGQPLFAVGMLENIDEQRQMQESLRASEARFRAMFDNAALGIALLTLDRRVLATNQGIARITGYSMAELAQLHPLEVTLPDDRETGRELLEELVRGERSDYQVEKRYVHKDGHVFWGRVTYSVVPGPDDKPQYLLGVIEDITESRQAREQMEAQEQAYREQLEERVRDRTQALSAANARLVEEIQQRERAEAALAQKAAEEAVLSERTRLARELHDAVTQTLFAASLTAEVLPELWQMSPEEGLNATEELRQLTRGALAEMRTLLFELRPAALTQARLGDLLQQLTEALIGRARLPVELRVRGERELPPEVLVALYRIAQESLNNAIKHARAGRVTIDLELTPAGAHLEIADDGAGIDPARPRPTSLGMRIMRERAEAIGADLLVSGAPGQGTTVAVTWNDQAA